MAGRHGSCDHATAIGAKNLREPKIRKTFAPVGCNLKPQPIRLRRQFNSQAAGPLFIRDKMKWPLHSNSLRYALALWLATVLALFISFLLQLEPAQWSGITVWIVFIQDPRLNYSKILWWAFGTIVGAAMATFLMVCFNQAPVLFILSLSLWLAICAAAAKLVNYYRAYGWVLAGYTCAIVSMSTVDHPDQAFLVAVTRVSCIFIGMTSAVIMIVLLLPRHRHWRETRHQLTVHLKASLLQAAKALTAGATEPARFTWRHMVDRLSTLEHTLDITTAESPDARIHTPQARSLVATLFDLLATAQALEIHLSRPQAVEAGAGVKLLADRANSLLIAFGATVAEEPVENPTTFILCEIEQLRNDVALARHALTRQMETINLTDRFVLDRLAEMLESFDRAIRDWSGLYGPWKAGRHSRLMEHRDYPTAVLYGLRMFVTINLAGIFWFLTQWPSGPQFILFIAVTCSLLSLVDYAPRLGFPFLKSAAFCAIMAYVEAFWLFQKGEGFLLLALSLGVFLLPAAYAYRHPRLIGGAVVSMLVFYGLAMPANEMNYDISAFLNNGVALLAAAAGGFFAFHAIPSLAPKARKYWLLRAVRNDLAQARMRSEQHWTSYMFDRLRLLHRTADHKQGLTELLDAENELLLCLQLGLRQFRLGTLLKTGALEPDEARVTAAALHSFREIARHPANVAALLDSSVAHLEEMVTKRPSRPENTMTALAELKEMLFLLKNPLRLYHE